ncbi:MAG: RHS repeat-associated core domain-containing protein [Rugosibacter sp.]|nr:MAG: RHS repeat-associated core domain-containing protein [Rugosibacter sp.]TBR07900.1 MAG: RHS repeat-associated core domain-containing protein [Rugosibacter sp.]
MLGKGRIATVTSFNMPSVIYNDATSNVKLELSQYGPEHQRLKSVVTSAAETRSTIYLNPDNSGSLFYEKETRTTASTVEQRHYLTAYGMTVALVKQTSDGKLTTTVTRYFHRDPLNSPTAITDDAGAVVERLGCEPYGNRRFANGTTDPNNTIIALTTPRGFTNHEHFDELDLIHMNGRIYDPVIGRFLSPDPYLQAPGNLQSYNRYAYCFDNPLVCTDPSGYFNLFKSVSNIVKAILNDPIRAIVTIAIVYYTGQYIGSTFAASAGSTGGTSWAVASTTTTGYTLTVAGSATAAAGASFAGSYVASGGDFRTATRAAASGALFGAVDGYYGKDWSYERLGANALAGGISAKIYGTDFATGFTNSFVTGAARWAYSSVGYDTNPMPGENRPNATGDATYDFDVNTGRQFSDSIGNNVVGGNNLVDFCKQQSICSKILNLIPGINATAGLHDHWFNIPGAPHQTAFINWGTMLPAAAITYSALINGPLTVQLSEKRR